MELRASTKSQTQRIISAQIAAKGSKRRRSMKFDDRVFISSFVAVVLGCIAASAAIVYAIIHFVKKFW
jgi:hypothetical protein